MNASMLSQRLPAVGLVAVLLTWAGAGLAGSIEYRVQFDTTSLLSQTGALDFQFEPGVNSAFATADVTGFAADGTPGAVTFVNPDASGALPGTLQFDNAGFPNEITQNFTFGSFFDLVVDLNIATPVSPSQTDDSTFSLAVYDQNGTPMFQADAGRGDPALFIDLHPDASAAMEAGSALTVTAQSAVPEPSALLLATLAAAGALSARCCHELRRPVVRARGLSQRT